MASPKPSKVTASARPLGHVYDPALALPTTGASGSGRPPRGSRRREELLELVAETGSGGSGPGHSARARQQAWDPATEPPVDKASPWNIDPSQYPIRGSSGEKLRFCLKYAVLAPSSHNSQPWKFLVDGTTVDLLADRTRALPVCDPLDRELTISCGAALEHLVLGMKRHGLEPAVAVLPKKAGPDVLARVTIAGKCAATPVEELMAGAIVHRRTTRHRFQDVQPPMGLMDELTKLAGARGASLVVLRDARSRERLATLVAEADMIQLGQAAFRRELAMWMHHNRSKSPDGMPGFAMGMGEVASLVAPLVIRRFDIGRGRAAKDKELALHSPVLAVLSTERDDVAGWLAAGRALAAVLLRGTADKLQASYLNQPVELRPPAQTREGVARLVGGGGSVFPQIVLRMGYGPGLPHTPRRPVEAVLTHEGDAMPAAAVRGRGGR